MTPAKYFLALDGMKGDSLNSNHKGWFEVSDFDIDLDNVFAGAPGGPGGPGKADFSPLTLTLDSNTGLAPLLALAATGDHLNGATLVGVTAGSGKTRSTSSIWPTCWSRRWRTMPRPV